MSDSDSDSDSDNNNDFPITHAYNVIRLIRARRRAGIQMVNFRSPLSSSVSESDGAYSDSDDFPSDYEELNITSEVMLNISSDDSDGRSSQNSNSSSVFLPFIGGTSGRKVNITVPKNNNWCIPRELYKRQIGFYNKHSKWNSNFYGSRVAVQKLVLARQLLGHDGCVNSLNFNTTGNLLTSGSDDCNICLWDWAKNKCLMKFKSGHIQNVFQTKFLTTQSDISIVSSGRDGLVILSIIKNGSNVVYNKPLAHHQGSCNKLGVHSDLPFIVLSCGDDGKIKNIDIRESPIEENLKVTNILNVTNIQGTPLSVLGIDLNPIKSYEFIVNCNDEYVRMYDKRKLCKEPMKNFRRLPPHNNYRPTNEEEYYNDENYEPSQITSAVYNYNGTEILASYSDDDIYLFDANGSSNSVLHHYSGHLNKITVKGVNFYGPRSEFVMSGSDCQHIFIWDKNTEAILLQKHADSKGAINVLEGHPHVPTLATSGIDTTIKIWEPLSKCLKPAIRKLRKTILRNRLEKTKGLQTTFGMSLGSITTRNFFDYNYLNNL